MSIFNTMHTSASAMTAERLRMDVISNNVANAQTTRTADGGPYQRQRVVFTPMTQRPVPFAAALRGEMNPNQGVRVAAVVTDERQGSTVYDPEHPDADAEGYVEMPNVDIVTEMIDMMSARRAYEANATVIQATKEMARTALNIGR